MTRTYFSDDEAYAAMERFNAELRAARLRLRRVFVLLVAVLLAWLLPGFVHAVEWPAGVTELPRPIEYRAVAGSVLRGNAAAQFTSNGNRSHDATILAWTGDAVEAMVRLSGSETVVEHIAFHGRTLNAQRNGTAKTPSIGVLIERTAEGLATGRTKAYSVNIAHVDVGLQIGMAPDDAQCAEGDWRSMWFDDCPTAAVRIVPAMAIGHRFESIRMNNCPTGFLIEGGGKLLVDGLFTATSNTTFVTLRPRRGLDGKPSIAHNNAAYEFRNVYADSQAANLCVLDMADWNYGGSLIFNRGKIPVKAASGSLFKLAGAASVTIRDYDSLPADSITWHNSKHVTRVLVENSCLPDGLSLFNPDASTGELLVLVRDCYRADFSPVKDFDKVYRGTKERD